MYRKAFFEEIRPMFGGRLTETQVATMDAIITAWTLYGDETGNKGLAYCMAIARHELGPVLKPIEENLNYSAARMIEVWPSRFKSLTEALTYVGNPEALANKVYGDREDLGNNEPGDGWRFRGRGISQLTGRTNYEKFSPLIGFNLVREPDKLLDPLIGARVLVVGMVKGLFTGRALRDYFLGQNNDAFNARSIVNGDKNRKEGNTTVGQIIAGYYAKFRVAIEKANEASNPAPDPITIPTTTPVPRPDPVEPPAPWWLLALWGLGLAVGVIILVTFFPQGILK